MSKKQKMKSKDNLIESRFRKFTLQNHPHYTLAQSTSKSLDINKMVCVTPNNNKKNKKKNK